MTPLVKHRDLGDSRVAPPSAVRAPPASGLRAMAVRPPPEGLPEQLLRVIDEKRGKSASSILAAADNLAQPALVQAWVVVEVFIPYAARTLVAWVFGKIFVAVAVAASVAAGSIAGTHGKNIGDPHNAFPLFQSMEVVMQAVRTEAI